MAKTDQDYIGTAAVSIPLRPDPPADFTTEQAKIWLEGVKTKPPQWFESDVFPLLRAYCIASDYHTQIYAEMKKLKITDATFRSLLDLQNKQSKIIAELATKMRLTQQSRYTPKAAATANKNTGNKDSKKPWE